MSKSMRFAVLLAAATLAGCGSSPKVNFYTLSADAAPPQAAAPAPYSVAIGAVTIPDAVDRAQFVVRTGPNQVTVNEFEVWAGSLKTEIPRVVAGNLAQLLAGASVFAYPLGGDADIKVLLDVQRFESAPGDAATIEVLWTVQPAKGALRIGRSVAREATAGTGYDALAAAHSRALAAVSRDIASAVRAARDAK
jgi:uncharacterized lipoprotein YmbA